MPVTRGKPAQKRGRGRPSKYNAAYADQARKLCLLGATDSEMADFFGVNEDTVHEWKKIHPEFSESITRGKLSADANVAERLYERAIGYSHEAVKIFMPQGAPGPVYAPYTEHFPPDTQAASLWLRNRQPAKWRDKVVQEITGKDGGPVEVSNVRERIASRLARLAAGGSASSRSGGTDR